MLEIVEKWSVIKIIVNMRRFFNVLNMEMSLLSVIIVLFVVLVKMVGVWWFKFKVVSWVVFLYIFFNIWCGELKKRKMEGILNMLWIL